MSHSRGVAGQGKRPSPGGSAAGGAGTAVGTRLRRQVVVLEPNTLVNARLYPSEAAVMADALRALLQEKPQLRIELAV